MAEWSFTPPFFRYLLRIRRIVEEHCELDAAVAELWKVRRTSISWIKIRCRIVGWEDNQRVQEGDQVILVLGLKPGIGIARCQRFAAMAQNYLVQVDTASIVSIRTR